MKKNLLWLYAIMPLAVISCQPENKSADTKDMGSVERSEIADQYKWNLADLYASDKEWEKERDMLKARMNEFSAFKGQLGGSAGKLAAALDTYYEVLEKLYKLNMYAYMLYDEDTRQTKPATMTAEVDNLWNGMGSATSFMEPEILQIPRQKLNAFFVSEPGLRVYQIYIENIKRMEPHTLTPEEEGLLAKAGGVTGIAREVNNILSNAEIPYKKITLSDGREVVINEPGYGKYRYEGNRGDRIAVFDAFYNTLKNFRLSKAALLNGKIKENIFYTRARNYDNVLQMHLFPKHVPEDVYLNLIENIKENLAPLHRYLSLRKGMLGLDELHYYDFYPQMVSAVSTQYPIEKGEQMITSALQVLGPEYSEKLKEAFENRWIDVYPNAGKASGAYSDAAYDTHPYVHVNYNNKFDDVSMLAHELGHAMHSYFSNKTQPYPFSDYSSFVAEVAATCNEALLVEAAMKTIEDPKEKLAILCNYAESFRQTIYRQVSFAEFEYIINKRSEEGENLSADDFDAIYLDILRKYYGHYEGVSVIDDLYAHEWAYISHFFLGFYNYQYATSYMASIAVAEKILTEGQSMVDKYLQFLSSGGTKPPIELLKDLGVDMTSKMPFELAMKKYNSILDEIETLNKQINN